MERIDNELECSARELLAYLDTESELEKSLPFIVNIFVVNCQENIVMPILKKI